MFRQGDVLLIPVSRIPKGLKTVGKEGGRVILAYGEVTGHAHAVAGTAAQLLEYADEKLGTVERYLEVKEKTKLTHEEHGAIDLEKGHYRVIRQSEYTPEAIRTVAD